MRQDTGSGQRIVRVGTHALKSGSRTTLWNRLSQHRGQAKKGGGNHRGSIYRSIVGATLLNANNISSDTWGCGGSAPKEIRESEQTLEKLVSKTIGVMPFLWLSVPDEPGPESLRGYIERNSIALLSNYNKLKIDPHSSKWLGNLCDREKVRESGLWNQNHVAEDCKLAFLDEMERLVSVVKG